MFEIVPAGGSLVLRAKASATLSRLRHLRLSFLRRREGRTD